MESQISEKEYTWIWDHYFSLILNKLPFSNNEILITAINGWAINLAKSFKMHPEPIKEQGLLAIRTTPTYYQMIKMELGAHIDVTAQANALPPLHVRLPNKFTEKQLEKSPIALANFSLDEDKCFYKELILHVISMKKYYAVQLYFSEEASLSSAPEFALNMAMQFHSHFHNKNTLN